MLVKLLVGLVVLSVGFGILQWRWPSIPRARRGGGKRRRFFRGRPGLGLDLAYWVFTPFVTGSATRVGLGLGVFLVAVALDLSLEDIRDKTYSGFGPLAQLPMGLQFLLTLLTADFIGYWCHRLFHRRRLWRFHAVHHSSEDLDWLSSVRVHPFNDFANKIGVVIPLFVLGFNPFVVAGAAPFLTLYALFLHANVGWSFGRFGVVLASPTFHRWHHSKEGEALDKNFAGLFPVWDLLFGTFYLPPKKVPLVFGTREQMPKTLWGQLGYPFFTKKSAAVHG